jgi:hypothetical protein
LLIQYGPIIPDIILLSELYDIMSFQQWTQCTALENRNKYGYWNLTIIVFAWERSYYNILPTDIQVFNNDETGSSPLSVFIVVVIQETDKKRVLWLASSTMPILVQMKDIRKNATKSYGKK